MIGYQIGKFCLDTKNNQLLKGNQTIDLSSRSLLLLRALAESSPQPLSKQELHELIWPETIVSDWSLSRLVSDTRIALGEDGDHQTTIKTERGMGFVITDAKPLSSLTQKSLQPLLENKSIFYFLAVIITGLLLFFAYAKYQDKQLYEAINRISVHQDNAYTAFVAQAKRRNQLVSMITERLAITRERQYELFFDHVAPLMNKEERFICQQMRAFSDIGLYQNNSAVLNTLIEHPKIMQEIPAAEQLAQHLRVWVNKYQAVFSKHPDMCLVYVGVEDGVPYPSEVDTQIREWLLAAD